LLLRALDALCSAAFGLVPRTVFLELLRIFLLALLALSGMFTMIAVLQQFQFGLSLGQVFKVLPLLIPSSIPWITPPACLFASCVVYGRIAHDQEAVALKAAGVNLYGLLRPAMTLGLLATIGTAALQFEFTPYAVRQSKELVIANPEEAITVALKKERTMKVGTSNSPETFTIFVRDVQDQRLVDVVVKHRKRGPSGLELERVARTREATIRVDLDSRKVMFARGDRGDGGWIYWSPRDSQPGLIQTETPLEFDLPERFSLDRARSEMQENEMSIGWSQLREMAQSNAQQAAKLERLRTVLEGIPREKKLSSLEQAEVMKAEGISLDRIPADAAGRELVARDCFDRAKNFRRLERKMDYEFHARIATAFACLLFAVLGCPVGLWASRSDYLSIFVICFLPALVVYYPIVFMAGGYARDGNIPMLLGVWTANAVLGALTVLLVVRLIRR